MIKSVINTKRYFQAPGDYFWRWAENTEVIEWMNGATICYRDELTAILRELQMKGVPPLSPLLLLLSACKKEIHLESFFTIATSAPPVINEDDTEYLLTRAIKFMQLIADLPQDLRTGTPRITLLQEVFESTQFVFSNTPLKDSLDELNSGRMDALLLEQPKPSTMDQFDNDLRYLSKALDKYSTIESLELKLRTGLDKLPLPAVLDTPESKPVDLFGQLEQDPKTIGISRLARKLTSALNIPMHSQGSGDQSYGGISDIANRGNYDKLLLSELAHDDILLMARLVNNEALYFRREEPPDNPKRKRTILLDSSLKMWGIPRVFALSAGLAFAHNSKHGEIIEAYALGGEKYTEVNFGTKEGVIQALGILHHALHCGKALQSVINEVPASEQNEYILFTEDKLLNSPEFHASLQHVREALSFIITVNRDGGLQFFECIKGKARLLSTAKLDLDELLFATGNLQKNEAKLSSDAPLFILQDPSPLLFPKIRIKEQEQRIFVTEQLGALVINETERLLFINDSEKGAHELLNFIERGTYYFGWDHLRDYYLLVTNLQKGLVKFYKIDTLLLTINSYDLSDKLRFAKEFVYDRNILYIKTAHYAYRFNCNICELGPEEDVSAHYDETARVNSRKEEPFQSGYRSKYLTWYGRYHTMYKIKEVFINDTGNLTFGKYCLAVDGSRNAIGIHISYQRITGTKYAKEKNNRLKLLPNREIKFSERTWADGSQAIIDSRGFVHLRSSDNALPEITIVLVAGADTTCWASDGTVCGAKYFIDEDKSVKMDVTDFYKIYIQPFIDRLQ